MYFRKCPIISLILHGHWLMSMSPLELLSSYNFEIIRTIICLRDVVQWTKNYTAVTHVFYRTYLSLWFILCVYIALTPPRYVRLKILLSKVWNWQAWGCMLKHQMLQINCGCCLYISHMDFSACVISKGLGSAPVKLGYSSFSPDSK